MTDPKKPTELTEADLDAIRGAGTAIPVETLSLNFEEIKYDYDVARPKLTDADGIRVPGVRAGERAFKS